MKGQSEQFWPFFFLKSDIEIGYNCSMIIYKITNRVSGKIYIGQTNRDINQRLKEHTFPSSGCKAIRDAIIKYGVENFTIEEVAKASSQDQLNILEKVHIETLETLAPKGYNLKDGGNSQYFAPETLKKMRQAKLGSTVSGEVKQKMSETHKKRFADNPELAMIRSKQTKAHWEDPEYRENLSVQRQKYWADPTNREKASEKAKVQVTDKYRAKISTAVKIALNTPEIQTKMDRFYKTQERAVVAGDGREFSSVKEAATSIGCPSSSIIKNIQGKYKSAGKLTWKYKEEHDHLIRFFRVIIRLRLFRRNYAGTFSRRATSTEVITDNLPNL